MAKSDPNKKHAVRFEDALAELADIVTQLEDGELGLDDSLAAYESGIKHLKNCHDLLGKAEKKIRLLQKIDENGQPVSGDFDDDDGASLEEKAGSRTRRRTGKAAKAGPSKPRTSSGSQRSATGGPESGDGNNVDEARGLF